MLSMSIWYLLCLELIFSIWRLRSKYVVLFMLLESCLLFLLHLKRKNKMIFSRNIDESTCKPSWWSKYSSRLGKITTNWCKFTQNIHRKCYKLLCHYTLKYNENLKFQQTNHFLSIWNHTKIHTFIHINTAIAYSKNYSIMQLHDPTITQDCTSTSAQDTMHSPNNNSTVSAWG